MIQPSDALNVWHFTNGQLEYIIAATGATNAAEAFERVNECRGQRPQRFPEVEANFSGRSLAIANPGTIYRRKVSSRPANGPH